MNWHTAFHSSNVAGFAYRQGVLYVRFRSGHVYGYDVPKEVYRRMLAAPSKGKFVHQELYGHELGQYEVAD